MQNVIRRRSIQKQRTLYDDKLKKMLFVELHNPLLTHFLTHITARGCDRLPEIAKFVAYYKRYKFLIIRNYGRLFEIKND